MAPTRNWHGKERERTVREAPSGREGGTKKKHPETSSFQEDFHFQGFLKPSSNLLYQSARNL